MKDAAPAIAAVRFGRAVSNDLSAAECREWLVTNGLGSYASGTVAGTLTRRYHGLLVAALRPPVERTLLVTKIDESATYRGTTYKLGANRWRSDYVAPTGFLHLVDFHLEGTSPVWRYALAEALLEKRIWMERNRNRTYVTYSLTRATQAVSLTLRVFGNYRGFHGNTHAGTWQLGVQEVAGGARVDAYEGAHPYWIVADAGTATIENLWYRDFALAEEARRGLDPFDDNAAIVRFDVSLAPGAAVTVVAADTAPDALDATAAWSRKCRREAQLVETFRATLPPEVAAPAWIARCALAADAFRVRRPIRDNPKARSVIAGYHWFGDWGRDTMIALPGLTLACGKSRIAASILRTFASFVDGGMIPNVFPDDGSPPQYNSVDAPLWFIEAAAAYVDATGDDATLRALWPALTQVVDAYVNGTRYGIHVAADGLVVAGDPGLALTWMDARVGARVITPRYGKPIEISALWYNALERMQRLAARIGDDPARVSALSARTRDGFARFWNAERGCCFDVVDGPSGDDPALRPNQLFAVALAHSPLDAARQRDVVAACAPLVTSYGLRTLDPTDPAFAPSYGGDQAQRDGAYHQGTVWPWLIASYALAHFRVYGDRQAALSLLDPFASALDDAGLGTVGEIADGSEPFTPRGAIAQAWSVAEVLRAWSALQSATAPR